MEERIIDDPRKIKVKKNAAGGIKDVTDEAYDKELEENPQEELFVELPEDETDEDLIGLSPEQLKVALEKREKAAEEARRMRDELLGEGEKALSAGSFSEAEGFFVQALVYDGDCERAKQGVWLSRTRGFRDLDPFYILENAQEISSDEETRAFIRKKAGETLWARRKEYEAEEGPLSERVLAAQELRRGKFAANRNYWLVRFLIAAGFFALFLIGVGVSASFLYRTNTLIPIILIAVFGGLALVTLGISLLPLRKLVWAQSYCNSNDRLSSTEDGARLEFLRNSLNCLRLILDD